jgi:hypothetical protein
MDAFFMPFGVSFLNATTGNAASSLLEAIATALEAVVGFFGTIVNALLTDGGALAALWPLVGIAIAFGLVTAGVNLIARFAPGL